MKNIHTHADACKFHISGQGVDLLRQANDIMSNQHLMRQSVTIWMQNSLCKAATFGDMTNHANQHFVTSPNPNAFTSFAILTLQSMRCCTLATPVASPQPQPPLRGNQDVLDGHATQVMVLLSQNLVCDVVKHAVSKTLGRCYFATANRHLYRSRLPRHATNSPAP